MLIVKLVVGLAIAIAVLYAVFRAQRRLRGDSAAGLVSAGIRRTRGERAADLERFVAEFRAQQSPALARRLIDSSSDPRLGIDLHRAAVRPVLEGPARLLFLLLKTSLPDHHVLVHARLGGFLRDAPAAAGAHAVDFLVCDRAFTPVCAVTLGALPDNIGTLLHEVGMRHLSVEAGALPRRHQLRAMVLGNVS